MPYKAETPIAIVLKHLISPVPPARQLHPNLPEVIEPILLKVLAKQAAGRFVSAGELGAALHKAMFNFEATKM